ncbi:MAG: PQQ-binding-like beta-propeller repeat protein [Verrucomicrobiota bacterium]
MKTVLLFACLTLSSINLHAADWPQWRGPTRNGIATSDGSLPAAFTKENPPSKVWQSDEIPSDHYGGHGSVIISQGKVFLSLVWHRDEPTDTRTIDGNVLGALGYRGTKFSDQLIVKMEADRLSLNPRLRGGKLDQWAQDWTKENLSEDQQIRLGSWVVSRFKKGKAAFAMADFKKLEAAKNKTFANQAALEKWVQAQGFDEAVAQRILAAVPDTKKAARDVIICLDEKSGKTLWKFESEGQPTGRASSSTPATDGQQVYAALSTHLYALDTKGKLVWKTPLTGRKGPASSPLVVDGQVYLQQNHLSAFDSNTGKEVWTNKEVNGANQSPAYWQSGEHTVIICNSSKEVIGVDAKSGKTLWKQAGGGDATPTVNGDYLVIASRQQGHSLAAYKLSITAAQATATPLWAMDFRTLRYGASPIIYQGHAYHLGSKRHLCIELESGKITWQREASSTISSPVLSDGKLLVYENNGGMLSMIKADAEDYNALGRTKIGALRCASPAIVGTRLFLRTKDSVVCYDLGEK